MTALFARDLPITVGVAFADTFVWTENDTPVTFPDGTTARAEIRPAAGDSHLLVAFATAEDTTADGTLTLGADGSISLALPEEATRRLHPRGLRPAVYDLFVHWPAGTVGPDGSTPTKVLAGTVPVEAAVTAR